ncbi:MAG: hypothetical protein WB489_09990, partial [Pseudolabrys sp.]
SRLLRGIKGQGTTRFISARRWICAQVLEFAAERFRLSAGQQMKQRYRLPNDDVDRGNPNRDHRDDDQPNTDPTPHLRTVRRNEKRQ